MRAPAARTTRRTFIAKPANDESNIKINSLVFSSCCYNRYNRVKRRFYGFLLAFLYKRQRDKWSNRTFDGRMCSLLGADTWGNMYNFEYSRVYTIRCAWPARLSIVFLFWILLKTFERNRIDFFCLLSPLNLFIIHSCKTLHECFI